MGENEKEDQLKITRTSRLMKGYKILLSGREI